MYVISKGLEMILELALEKWISSPIKSNRLEWFNWHFECDWHTERKECKRDDGERAREMEPQLGKQQQQNGKKFFY